jgi:hypothetical protein
MSRSPRVLALLGACALVVASLGLASPPPLGAADAASTASAAVAWLVTQQQSDGGFEVAQFPGFETRDASLAIAENAQTSGTWSTGEARAALAAIHFGGGSGPTPLDALDAEAASDTTAGAAAKTIVLSAFPLGLDSSAFDANGDGNPVDLASKLDSGCGANTPSFGVFNDTLYGILAKTLVCGAAPPAALATVRAAQQVNGGWSFSGKPDGSDLDIDTSALAIEALVAGGANASDANVHAGLAFLAAQHQPSGAWQAFGADDPNSTALAVLGITSAGFDVTSSCWRDTVDPAAAGTPYTSPDAWTESQQQPDGHIASPNDAFPPVNTFATAQAVEGLLRSWLPIVRAPAETCAVTPPSPAPPTSSTTNPAPGDAVTLTGGGFAASTTLTVTLRSDPVVLASTTTDATGSYSVTVTIPLDTPPGVHQLVVSGLDPNGQEVSTSVDITVSAAAAGPVAADGANLQPAFTG